MLVLLPAMQVAGQQAGILVRDAKTSETLPNAHVCFEELNNGKQIHVVTDLNGFVPNKLTRRAKVAISYVGYETANDTIEPGQKVTVQLVPSVLNVDEVVVTAQFTPEKADKSIYKINVINSRQIEQRAASNLSDLLRTESNMKLSDGGVLGTSLSMQGLTGENVKILVDGVPIIGRLNGNLDLNQLNLFNVDHIEVIEGPMSVIYGSNAIAGVINIITRENRASTLHAYSNAYYETVGVYNMNAGASWRKHKSQVYLDLCRNFFGGYQGNSASSRQLDWKPRRQWNADAYYLYSGNKWRIKLSAQWFDELLIDKGPLLAPYYETAIDNYFSTLRTTYKGESSYKISDNRNINLLAAYSLYNRQRDVYANDLTIPEKTLVPAGDTTGFGNLMLRSMYNRNLKSARINYQFGLDGTYEWSSGERIDGNQRSIGDYATFLSLRYEPRDNISIQPGVRLMYNTQYHAPVVYSFNARYAVTQHTSLRASYARGFRAPSIKELYLNFVDINHDIQGNQNLKAEYSHNVNLFFTYNRETKRDYINSEAGLFYNFVDNTIWLFNTGSSSTSYTYGNVARFISQGAQYDISISFYPRITLKGGIALTGRRFPKSSLSTADTHFNYSTDFSGMASWKWQKSGITFVANYKYTGRYPVLSPEGDFQNQYIAGYHMLDVSMSRDFLHNRLNVALGGKNLMDVRDVIGSGSVGTAHSSGSDGSSRVAWGRTAFVKLTYNFHTY